jgi:hypothetical protein
MDEQQSIKPCEKGEYIAELSNTKRVKALHEIKDVLTGVSGAVYYSVGTVGRPELWAQSEEDFSVYCLTRFAKGKRATEEQVNELKVTELKRRCYMLINNCQTLSFKDLEDIYKSISKIIDRTIA